MSASRIGFRRTKPEALCLALALLGGAAVAQDHTNHKRGTEAATSFAYDQLDAVNLYNGNLTIGIPIGQEYPVGGGLTYSIGLHYNSNVWEFEQGPFDQWGFPTTTAYPDPHGNAGLGWIVSLGRLHPPLSGRFNTSTTWLLVEPDGTRRLFAPTLHDGETATANVFYTRDGSYLRMRKVGTTWEVESPNGVVRVFNAAGHLTQVRDRTGNQSTPAGTANSLSIAMGANLWTLTDNSNYPSGSQRTHEIEFYPAAGDIPQRVKAVRLAGFGGATATYTFSYLEDVIARHPDHDSEGLPGGEPNTIAVALLSEVTLPDGRKFTMQYYLGNSSRPEDDVFNPSGTLRTLTLPTRGRYEWEYGGYAFNGGGGEPPALWLSKNTGVRFKKVIAPNSGSGTELGLWSYRQGPAPGGPPPDPMKEVRTWVTSPLGDVTVCYFTTDYGAWNNGLPLASQRSSGSRYLSKEQFFGSSTGAGALRRTEWVRYTADPNPGISVGQDNQRVVESRTVYEDGSYAGVAFSEFDGFGHFRAATTDGNFGAGDVRTSKTNFNPLRGIYDYDAESATFGPAHSFSMLSVSSPWLLELYDHQQWSEGGSSSRTNFTFDPSTGFLAAVRTLKSGTATRQDDVLALRCPDARGNLTAEIFYGGDVQSLSGLDPTCSAPGAWQYRILHEHAHGALASSIYRKTSAANMEFYSYKATIDPSTGLASQEEDPSGYATKFTFDALGRLTLIEPGGSLGGAEAGAKTSYTYLEGSGGTGGRVQIAVLCPSGVTCSAPSPGSFGQSLLVVDGFGRLIRERTLQANGTTSRKHYRHNAMGWKTEESETGEDSDSNPVTTYGDFDPFGRPRLITPPDGTAHAIALDYQGVKQVSRTLKIASQANGSEASSTTTEIYDRQGRLWKVWEPSAAGGANLNTIYAYDVDGRLTGVSHNTGGSAIQSRSFVYDHRGYLTLETHPEKGSGGNGTVTYRNYDARGHALEKWDTAASRSLLFAYDKAERLTAVSEGGTGGRSLKEFTFGTSGVEKGKLKTAVRWNYFPAFGQTVKVTETYSYGGPGRRTTARSTLLNYQGADRERFDQTFTWNRDGSLQSQGYPRCFNGGCGAGGTAGRTVSYDYSNGFLAGIQGYASLGYHLNGTVSSITHTNGVTVTIAGDPALIRRPAEIQIAGPGWSQSTGAYAYDGAGNIKSINTDRYVYDGASRLVVAQMGLGGQTNTQSYAYDPLGNITSITTNAVARNTPTSASTNHLAAATYDGGGNLLSWNGQVYEYDRLNMPTRRTVGSEDWLFAYTADDERIWSYRTGLGGYVITVRDIDGTVLRRYDAHLGWTTFTDSVYRDAGNLLASETSAGVRSHFHLDHLGSPRLQSNGAGSIARFYSYYPYGEELFPALDTQPIRFTGHERDLLATSGTDDDADYMLARQTTPLLARFLGPDRFASAIPRFPQSWNAYAYCKGNPLVYTDPDGNFATLALSQGGFRAALAALAVLSEAGPAGLVAGAGIGSVYIGLKVNESVLPSGQRTGDWISDGLSGLIFSQNAAKAREFIDTKIATIAKHTGKYPLLDPNDPDERRRKNNIYRKMMGHLKDAFKELKNLGGKKQQEEYLRRLLKAQRELDQWWKHVP